MPVSEHRIALPTRYNVVRHIANGGMASVWLAEDELLGRLVAVKVLSSGYAQDERANRRFVREARAGARLSECRHVVTVYDIGEHDGRPFMVMEHFSGGTVADRQAAALVDEQVGRLDVAVDDVVGVRAVQRVGRLAQPAQGQGPGDVAAVAQAIGHGAAREVLHHHERAPVVLADVVDGDDVAAV